MPLLFLTLITFLAETLRLSTPPPAILLRAPVGSVEVFIDGKKWREFKVVGDTLFLPEMPSGRILVSYLSRELKDTYFLYSLKEGEGANQEPILSRRASTESESFNFEGHKNITLSTSREGVSLSQGVYLRVTGPVGKGMLLEGLIEDNGGGEEYATLRELDQAYMSIRGKGRGFRAGVFRYRRFDSEVPIVGISIGLEERNTHMLKFAYGQEKGPINRMVFVGENGKQGPYILRGSQGEENIEVIKGTERVWVDGIPMIPGKEADYILDPQTATVTFTPRRPILKGQRIEILFQYRTSLWEKRVTHLNAEERLSFGQFGIEYFEERDAASLRRLGLENWQIDSLRALGDSAGNREILAAFYVGNGRGRYTKEGDHFTFVGEGKGDYKVDFTYLGEGKGSYIWEPSIGGYVFKGEGLGSYEPYTYLNPPSRNRLLSFYLVHKKKRRSLSLKVFGSDRDLNTFSPFDDRDNRGRALELNFEIPFLVRESKGWFNVEASGRENFYHPSLRWGGELDEWLPINEKRDARGFLSVGLKAPSGWGIEGSGGEILRERERLISWKVALNSPFPRPLAIEREEIRRTGPVPFQKSEKRARWTEKIRGVSSIFSFGVIRTDTSYLLEWKEEIEGSPGLPLKVSLLRRRGDKERLDMLSLFVDKGSEERSSFSFGATFFNQPLGTTVGQKALFQLEWKYLPERGWGIWGGHHLNSSSLLKKEERYVYVGLGRGDYRYDPLKGKYVPEQGGDFKREFINIREIAPATLIENSFGANLSNERGDLNLSLRMMEKYPGMDSYIPDRGSSLLEEWSFLLSGSLRATKSLSLALNLRNFETLDREISDQPRLNREKSLEVALNLKGAKFKRELGLLYEYFREGTQSLISWGTRSYGLFFKMALEEKGRGGSVKVSGTRRWAKDLLSSSSWIPFDVLSVKPEAYLSYRGIRIRSTVEGRYGRTSIGAIPSSPLFPRGWYLSYSIRASKPLSEKTRLSLELLGDRQKGYPPRENLSFSLSTDF